MRGENFIRGYQLDEKLCDSILQIYKNAPDKFKKAGFQQGKSPSKKSTDLTLHPMNERTTPIMGQYISFLEQCLEDYQKDFEILKYNNNLKILETFNIQHYKPGEGFPDWHYEFVPGVQPYVDRVLVFMTYLNDVEDGGTDFAYQQLNTKASKGVTLIWPAYFTHTHRGQITDKQEKTIVTGWFSHDRNDTANK